MDRFRSRLDSDLELGLDIRWKIGGIQISRRQFVCVCNGSRGGACDCAEKRFFQMVSHEKILSEFTYFSAVTRSAMLVSLPEIREMSASGWTNSASAVRKKWVCSLLRVGGTERRWSVRHPWSGSSRQGNFPV